jgi:addiction module RelE/StbE family toxin
MNIEWSGPSLQDIQSLWTYIATGSVRAASRQVRLIEKAVSNLKKLPQLGRAGRCAGTRELVVPKTPYVIVYRLKNKKIEILRVIHERQQWPDSL